MNVAFSETKLFDEIQEIGLVDLGVRLCQDLNALEENADFLRCRESALWFWLASLFCAIIAALLIHSVLLCGL